MRSGIPEPYLHPFQQNQLSSAFFAVNFVSVQLQDPVVDLVCQSECELFIAMIRQNQAYK